MLALDIINTAATNVSILAGTIPDPAPVQPPGTEGVTTLLSWIKYIGYIVVAGAIIVGGIMISVSMRRGDGNEALPKIIWPCAGAIVIGAGASIIGAIAGV